MTDRLSRMDAIIKYVSTIVKDNDLNDRELHNFVYYTITRNSVSEEDKNVDFSSNGTFNKIISDFEGKKTKVYMSPSLKNVCTFRNRENEFYDSEEEIKIYVPVDGDNMYKSLVAIFNFLDENDIPHVSNVGKNVRCDNIVCRFKNSDDATLFLKFLRDERRVRGIVECNPFAYSKDGIAMVCDGTLSYNSVMTDIMCKFITKSKDEHSLIRNTADEFINFVKSYYVDYFIHKDNLEEVIGDFTIIEDSDNSLETNKLIVNVKNIIELFLKSLDKYFGYQNFIEEYNIRCDKDKISKEAVEYKNARKKSSLMKLSSVDNFLFKTIDIIIRKEKNNDDEAIEKGLSDKRCSNYEKKALNVLECYLSTGNVNYLTRSEGLREDVKEFDFANKINDILSSSNISFEEYYSQVKDIKQKKDLKNAIIVTYEKYQKKYESGFSDYDGIEFVTYGIDKLIKDGNYGGFTRDGNVRYELSMFTKPTDVVRIIEKVIGKELKDIDDITLFVNEIINKNNFNI